MLLFRFSIEFSDCATTIVSEASCGRMSIRRLLLELSMNKTPINRIKHTVANKALLVCTIVC